MSTESRFFMNNRAYEGAYRKGASAARNGGDRNPPYGENLPRFQEAWLAGYDSVPRAAPAAAQPA